MNRSTVTSATSTPGKTRGTNRRGADTRRKIEEAAGQLFTERGYPSTTMQAIADEAGVHVQTVYLAYGTKAAVLAATGARLVAGREDPSSHPSERAWARAVMAATDPAEKIRLYVRHIADVTSRTLRLIDMLRVTATAEVEVAEFLERMLQGRWEGAFALLGSLADEGVLRPHLEATDAADITYALASQETFRALIEERGWSATHAETWVAEQLEVALLPR